MPGFSTSSIHSNTNGNIHLPTSEINFMTPQQNVETYYNILGAGAQQGRIYKFLARRNLAYWPPRVSSNGNGVSAALAARYNLDSVQNVQFRIGY